MSTEGLSGISRLNASIHNFIVMSNEDRFEVGYAILDIDNLFESINIPDVLELINQTRAQSGFSRISETDIIDALGNKRTEIKQIIAEKLESFSTADYIELVTIMAEKCIADRAYGDGVVIGDVIDNYEIRMKSAIDEKEEAKMYHHINNYLKKKNFIHYETSNFAKKGYESIHNLIYWNCNEYVALGPSGSFYLNKVRGTNVSNVLKYIELVNNGQDYIEEQTVLSIKEQMEEEIILGLRKTKGINYKEFENKFSKKITNVFPKISNLISEGLLKEKNEFIYIPQKYFYICNHILVKILE